MDTPPPHETRCTRPRSQKTLINVLIMPRLLPLLVALLISAPAFAQDALTPGHPDIDTSIFDEDEGRYVIHIIQGPMEQDIGTVKFTFAMDEEAGQLHGIRAYEMMGQKLADSLVVAWPSLAVISHVSDNMQRTLRYTVADGMISGSRNAPGGEPEAFEMSVDGPVFDASWMSIIASMLPLADGYEATVTAFEDDEAGVGDFTLTTSGPTELALSTGQKVDAWKVAATNPDGETVQYFFSSADRSLMRVEMNPQPGLQVFIDAEMGQVGK